MTRRGFTLMEALLSLGLVFILLGIVASLVSLYSQITRRLNQNQNTLYAARVALDHVARDLSQALVVDTPAVNATSSTLTLQRIDPWGTARVPDLAVFPLPSPPDDWDPHDPSTRQTVEYWLDTSQPGQSRLLRKVTYGDGTSEEEIVCEGLAGLRFHGRELSVEVTATVEEQDVTPRILPLTTEVFLHRPERLVPP